MLAQAIADRVMPLVDAASAALLSKKAQGVTILDVSKLSSVADRFVIASGGSRLAVQAMATAVREALEELGCPVLRQEGLQEGRWVCLDYGDLVVHVFQHAVRDYFDLERLWADAPREVRQEDGIPATVTA